MLYTDVLYAHCTHTVLYRCTIGVLLGLGSLSDHMQKRKMYAQTLEGMLVQHVFPEFQSKFGFMRMRASWMMVGTIRYTAYADTACTDTACTDTLIRYTFIHCTLIHSYTHTLYRCASPRLSGRTSRTW
jgi:hypothetical protein